VVGVLVGMKLRVLRNSLRGRQIFVMVLGGLFGLLLAGFTALSGAIEFEQARTSVDVLASLYAAWAIGWILAPIALGGGDDTLRPEHFALLPIGRRKLAVGLLAASFVGVPTLVSLVAFLGLAFYGLRLGAGAGLVGIVFALLQLVFVVLVYRLVTAALGALLTSRKGKELGILLVAMVSMSGLLFSYVANSLGPALVAGEVPGLAVTVRILPSGWGTLAVRAAGDGDWGVVLGLLAGMVALISLMLVSWGALLRKRVTSPAYRGASRSKAATPGVRRHRSLLPETPVGAVAAKELRTWWRDARRRTALLSTLMVGVVLTVVPSVSGGGDRAAMLPFVSLYFVVFASLQSANLYGLDGSALWHTLVVPGADRADVRGRQLGWALVVAPFALLLAVVVPGLTGEPSAYPWVLGLLPALVGGGAGVMMLQSVYLAYPLPDQRRNSSPWASGGRPGCARALLMLAMTLLLAVAALPVVAVLVAGSVTDSAVLRWAGVPVGIAMGIVLAWWWGRLAQRRLAQRGPELLATVSKER
jgi:ABC-2 type transport system permease protein